MTEQLSYIYTRATLTYVPAKYSPALDVNLYQTNARDCVGVSGISGTSDHRYTMHRHRGLRRSESLEKVTYHQRQRPIVTTQQALLQEPQMAPLVECGLVNSRTNVSDSSVTPNQLKLRR